MTLIYISIYYMLIWLGCPPNVAVISKPVPNPLLLLQWHFQRGLRPVRNMYHQLPSRTAARLEVPWRPLPSTWVWLKKWQSSKKALRIVSALCPESRFLWDNVNRFYYRIIYFVSWLILLLLTIPLRRISFVWTRIGETSVIKCGGCSRAVVSSVYFKIQPC